MWNKVISLISDQHQHINTLKGNVKHKTLVPGMNGGAAVPLTTTHMVVRLLKLLRGLWLLWKEWEQGLGRGKPAKAYTSAKGGAKKVSFLHQKVFWDTVKSMIRRGQTADVVINNVYRAYG